MTSRAYAPSTHGERATSIAAVDHLASDGVAPAVAKLIAARYQPTLAAYEAARVANAEAAVAESLAVDARSEADAAWTLALEQWLVSAYGLLDEAAVRAELKPLMRDLAPNGFVRLAARTRLELMPALDLSARERPELAGDLELLDALRDATTTFEEAVAAAELAHAHRRTTSKALLAATAAFDRAYGALVRAIRKLDPERAQVPTFHRSPPAPAPEPAKVPAVIVEHADDSTGGVRAGARAPRVEGLGDRVGGDRQPPRGRGRSGGDLPQAPRRRPRGLRTRQVPERPPHR